MPVKDETLVTWTMDEKKIATLIMHDKVDKNVFSHRFVDAFLAAFEEIEAANPAVCIIQGLPDVFCGGADKQSLEDLAAGRFVVRDLVVSERLINATFPIISAMEGHAMGGGLVVGLCSDMVIMANESRYGAVFMSMGFTPGMGTTTLLPLLVGPFIASEMMYTARRYKGKELAEKGVPINAIVPKAEVMQKARDLALQIADKNINSVHLLKYTLSAPKKKLLIEARLQEDMMHRLSFADPVTKAMIDDLYARG